MYRGFLIGLSVFAVAFGLLAIISPLTRGLGVTNGFIVGVVLVVAGSARLVAEVRRSGDDAP